MRFTLQHGILLSMLCLTSCSRYYRWGKRTFEQAKKIATDSTIAQKYLRDAAVYNTFDTVMLVDALWLHDDVRAFYAKLYAQRRGLSAVAYQDMLAAQRTENEHVLSFFVLLNVDCVSDDSVSLHNRFTTWSIMAVVDGVEYEPLEIVLTALDPEYEYIIGNWDKRFRTIYKVTFAAVPIKHEISLLLRSLHYEIPLTWRLRSEHHGAAASHTYSHAILDTIQPSSAQMPRNKALLW